MGVRLKRAYEAAAPDDGRRYLIDRLWPRGRSREVLALTEWRRELSPSTELREWYQHEPSRYAEFRRRYRAELEPHAAAIARLAAEANRGTITLVFSTREPTGSNAAVLSELIEEVAEAGARGRSRSDGPRTAVRK